MHQSGRLRIRKYKPKSYSLEKSVDSNFIHAEKLAKITAQNVEQSKKVLKRARLTLREIKRKGEN
jgi:uncharacterized SAM-binding protein YcdF (DUF218 family)